MQRLPFPSRNHAVSCLVGSQNLGDAKIAQVSIAVPIEEDVSRLDVAMNVAFLVNEIEARHLNQPDRQSSEWALVRLAPSLAEVPDLAGCRRSGIA